MATGSIKKLDPERSIDESTTDLKKFELSDSEDEGFQYAEVEAPSDDESDNEEEDLHAILTSLTKEKIVPCAASPLGQRASTEVRPSVVDDFIREFLIRMQMSRTLEIFNSEWYEMQAKGKLKEDYGTVPDVYLRNAALDEKVKTLREQLSNMQEITAKAKGTWDKFRKERDFHRMHHKRVVQEKNRLMTDIKRLKNHFSSYEPTLKEMKSKYEVVMKEKMLMRLERDRLSAKVNALESYMKAQEKKQLKEVESSTTNKKVKKTSTKSKLPSNEELHNPYTQAFFQPVPIEQYQLLKTFKGHANAISGIAFHPKKPILATVSDDETWKLWSVPKGELIMSGEGHRGWISGVDFHPQGTHLITSSGDNTVKLWDFATAMCSSTFSDHSRPVWETVFHFAGDFIASGSMDQTAKLWDLATGKCRQTFRGHVDSVNTVCFQPYSNPLCTGSGDKTVSLWDPRTGLCMQTFYGHMNACNNVTFNLQGDTIASCDADGIVKLWDIRMVSEKATLEVGHQPLNKIIFDQSGQILVVASDDGGIKLFDTTKLEYLSELKGHEDAIQAVLFEPNGKYLVSSSSDCTFRIWSV